MRPLITDEEIRQIKNGKISTRDAAKKLGRSISFVNKYRKIFKIDRVCPRRTNRKYNVNDNFFKKWSRGMAYILGFIAADGNISSVGNRLTISVCEKDKKILKIVKKWLNSNNPIHNYRSKLNNKYYPQCILAINSSNIYSDLISLGITPKKSLTLNWLKYIPEKYLSHFTRGYFDGDGCVCRKDKNKNCIVIILGTEKFLLKLKDVFSTILGREIGSVSRKSHTKTFILQISGNKIIPKVFNWMYDDSKNLRLERKFDIFDTHIKSLYADVS